MPISQSMMAARRAGAPDDLAVALLALLVRFNHYRHTGANRGLPDDRLFDSLAAFVQMALFPSTPGDALSLDGEGAASRTGVMASPPRGPARAMPGNGHRGGGAAERLRIGSQRVQQTVRRLLASGAVVFAEHGFHESSVDDVLRESGLGRGTFYTYFHDKLDLLVTLAEECAAALEEMLPRFVEVAGAGYDPDGLRAWLRDFVTLHRRYAGVFHAWTERDPGDAHLAKVGQRIASKILVTFDGVIAGVERPYPFDACVGSLVLLVLLERLPDYALGTAYDMRTERAVDVLATLVERGLLGRMSPHPGVAPPARR